MVKKRQNSKPNLVFVGAFIPRPLKAALEAYAHNEGRSVSATVRRILEGTPGVKAVLRQDKAA